MVLHQFIFILIVIVHGLRYKFPRFRGKGQTQDDATIRSIKQHTFFDLWSIQKQEQDLIIW